MKSLAEQIRILDCGLAKYGEILEKQHQLHEDRLLGKIPDTILIVEHYPVITLGARQSANKFLVGEEELAKNNIDVVETRRGGGTTAHNPGQIVFYPILNLQQFGLGINEYIRELEAIGIELLEYMDIQAQRKKGFPGLWVADRKIASIGVRVSKQITYHGMAINISNELNIFDLFVPCGLAGVEMTSVLKETGRKHPMNKVKEKLSHLLTEHFS